MELPEARAPHITFRDLIRPVNETGREGVRQGLPDRPQAAAAPPARGVRAHRPASRGGIDLSCGHSLFITGHLRGWALAEGGPLGRDRGGGQQTPESWVPGPVFWAALS